MIKVITYGTFDLLHYGHVNLLEKAKDFGDKLIVGISSDEFNEIKGKKSYFKYDHRKSILESIKFVDMIIPESSWDQKIDDIIKYDIDIFVIGDDWEGEFDYLRDYCEVIYIPRTRGISTSSIKGELAESK